MTGSGTSLQRAALGLQAAVTAAPVVASGSLSVRAFLVLVLASAAVFVAVLITPEDRAWVLRFELGAVALGAVLLVPGTVLGGVVLWLLLSRRGVAALDGRPQVLVPRPRQALPDPRPVTVDVLPR